MKTSTGNRSTGDYSTGHRSTGDWSTGDYSTGDYSTGDWSTGHFSTGNRSTGDYSTGHRSTGDYSISNHSTGHFSTEDYSGFGCFDMPCTLKEWQDCEKPNFIYFELTKWINSSSMTEEEKKANPNHQTTGGYLKVYGYQEAFKMSWDKASFDDKKKVFNLPNFDAEKFKLISGIDVSELYIKESKKQELIKKAQELLKQAEEL